MPSSCPTIDIEPRFYVSFDGGQWMRISSREYEIYRDGMDKHPAFWEGVRIAAQFTLV